MAKPLGYLHISELAMPRRPLSWKMLAVVFRGSALRYVEINYFSTLNLTKVLQYKSVGRGTRHKIHKSSLKKSQEPKFLAS